MSVKSQYLLNISARHQMNSRYKITGLQVIKVNRKLISQLHQKPVKVPFGVQQVAVFL